MNIGDTEKWGGVLYEVTYVGTYTYTIVPIKDKSNGK